MPDTFPSIYGDKRPLLEKTMAALLADIETIRKALTKERGMDPVEHLLSRVKSEESMREKCRRDGIPETEESALQAIHDAIGLRVVTPFLDDVYALRDAIAALPDIQVVNEKDFIRKAKPNGYRSYHMIVLRDGFYAEIQLRTISMDTWAALEHHMKYKKKIGGNEALIREELKRCADELASTDVSMQTIRNLIDEERD